MKPFIQRGRNRRGQWTSTTENRETYESIPSLNNAIEKAEQIFITIDIGEKSVFLGITECQAFELVNELGYANTAPEGNVFSDDEGNIIASWDEHLSELTFCSRELD